MTRRSPLWAAFCLAALGLALPLPAQAGDKAANPCYQTYPNIEGEVLLENDKVVVQRFVFPPGVWEGVHAHPADQLYIHIKGGHWTVRHGDQRSSGWSETGSVGWYGPVGLDEDHESVNSGNEPIDLIWVTLKTDCAGREWPE